MRTATSTEPSIGVLETEEPDPRRSVLTRDDLPGVASSLQTTQDDVG